LGEEKSAWSGGSEKLRQEQTEELVEAADGQLDLVLAFPNPVRTSSSIRQ
jgi:hypothetical protein